jgi:hypothetical protein
MLSKDRKTEGELIALLMTEVRQHHACDHVASVTITRPVDANWGAAWGMSGNKGAPAIAWGIERKLGAEFDIA